MVELQCSRGRKINLFALGGNDVIEIGPGVIGANVIRRGPNDVVTGGMEMTSYEVGAGNDTLAVAPATIACMEMPEMITSTLGIAPGTV